MADSFHIKFTNHDLTFISLLSTEKASVLSRLCKITKCFPYAMQQGICKAICSISDTELPISTILENVHFIREIEDTPFYKGNKDTYTVPCILEIQILFETALYPTASRFILSVSYLDFKGDKHLENHAFPIKKIADTEYLETGKVKYDLCKGILYIPCDFMNEINGNGCFHTKRYHKNLSDFLGEENNSIESVCMEKRIKAWKSIERKLLLIRIISIIPPILIVVLGIMMFLSII